MEKDHEGGIYNRDKPYSKPYRTTETANTHTHIHTFTIYFWNTEREHRTMLKLIGDYCKMF